MYFDPDFDPLACDSLADLQFQVRALATDLQVRGVGLVAAPIDLARDVYGVLLTLRAREEQWREAGLRAQSARIDDSRETLRASGWSERDGKWWRGGVYVEARGGRVDIRGSMTPAELRAFAALAEVTP